MYSIGEVAMFLGVSRDTLKFYEEKGLISPHKNKENGYREYDMMDIHHLFLINFYRDMDMEIKTIKELQSKQDIENLDEVLSMQEAKLKDEIQRKKFILNKIKDRQAKAKLIKKNLDKITIKENVEFEVLESIENYDMEDPRTFLNELVDARKNIGSKQKAYTLADVVKIVEFNDETILDESYIIVENKKSKSEKVKSKTVNIGRCFYKIEKTRVVVTMEEGIKEMSEVYDRCLREMRELGEKHKGRVYLKMMLTTYEDKIPTLYIEMFVPLE